MVTSIPASLADEMVYGHFGIVHCGAERKDAKLQTKQTVAVSPPSPPLLSKGINSRAVTIEGDRMGAG